MRAAVRFPARRLPLPSTASGTALVLRGRTWRCPSGAGGSVTEPLSHGPFEPMNLIFNECAGARRVVGADGAGTGGQGEGPRGAAPVGSSAGALGSGLRRPTANIRRTSDAARGVLERLLRCGGSRDGSPGPRRNRERVSSPGTDQAADRGAVRGSSAGEPRAEAATGAASAQPR